MKEANRIIVTGFGIILLASMIPHATNRSRAAGPDEPVLLKAQNKVLRAQLKSLQSRTKELKAQLAGAMIEHGRLQRDIRGVKAENARLQGENARLQAEVARLKRNQVAPGSEARTRPTARGANDPASLGIAVTASGAEVHDASRKDGIPQPRLSGLLVAKVAPGSPARRAGIQRLDIIRIVIDGKLIVTSPAFARWAASLKIGEPITLRVWRLETGLRRTRSWKRRLIKVVPASRTQVMQSAKYKLMPPRTVKKGIVAVSLRGAEIGKAASESEVGGAGTVSEKKVLSIFVGISNLSQERKVTYRTWAADIHWSEGKATRLTDNLGNVYKAIHLGLMHVPTGRKHGESIYPGKAILDALTFEPPVAKAKWLSLSLPLRNVGESGTAHFMIPVIGIKRD